MVSEHQEYEVSKVSPENRENLFLISSYNLPDYIFDSSSVNSDELQRSFQISSMIPVSRSFAFRRLPPSLKCVDSMMPGFLSSLFASSASSSCSPSFACCLWNHSGAIHILCFILHQLFDLPLPPNAILTASSSSPSSTGSVHPTILLVPISNLAKLPSRLSRRFISVALSRS